MDASVIIPTHMRATKLAKLVQALGRQDIASFEVLIGVDGIDEESERAARVAWSDAGCESARLSIIASPRAGQASVRNRLLPLARGETLIFLNDDMLPETGLVRAHVEAQREAHGHLGGAGAVVLGDSPWVVHTPDRLFDRLLRETSMVFFYHRMNEVTAREDRWRDWGFRHAWSLNLSVPAGAVREVGGFTVFPSTYGFEDDELAFRLAGRLRMPVLYRPEACAQHDHRMEPRGYLEREQRLGFASWGFARTTPECALAMYGRDITREEEIVYSRAYVERELRAAVGALRAIEGLIELPSDALADDPRLVELVYQQHLPLKRWMWRAGLIRAHDRGEIDDVVWPE
jgi:glycosyltransferase involved in cell wall biosynthesis